MNIHAPLKKLSKKERKFQKKPWVTKGIHGLLKVSRTQLIRRIDSLKISSVTTKIIQYLHNQYKSYRNNLSTLIKQVKKHYYNTYFKNNMKNIKSTWKEIKSIIPLETRETESPKIIFNGKGQFLTNPMDIVNSLNSFFFLLHQTSNIISELKPQESTVFL